MKDDSGTAGSLSPISTVAKDDRVGDDIASAIPVTDSGHPPQSQSVPSTMEDLDYRIRVLERQVVELRLEMRGRRRWLDKFRPTMFTLEQYPPRDLRVPTRYSSTKLPSRLPPIALVTPSFNQGMYIERTIRSVLSQGYPALRYTVQDGGSKDETHVILRQFEGQLSWIQGRDDGQSHAINLGFSRVEGEIMGWLNSDDMLLPGALAYVANYFADHPEVDVVYGQRVCVDRFDQEIGRIILPKHDPETIKWIDFIPQETMFWRSRVWNKLGGLDQNFDYAMDWDFILRAHAAGFHFHRLVSVAKRKIP